MSDDQRDVAGAAAMVTEIENYLALTSDNPDIAETADRHARERAVQLVVAGMVRIAHHSPEFTFALVADPDLPPLPQQVSRAADGWTCTCPAALPRCSHQYALDLVLVDWTPAEEAQP